MLTELFRDRWLMVVGKPHGLPSQPARGGGDDLYTLLAAAEPYVGLHHRLDQPASGCVLVALDPAVNKALAEAFRTHAIARTYVAVLAHAERLDGPVIAWDDPLDDKPARTTGEVLGTASDMAAVRLTLDTGRFHQLRRHAAIHHTPILGDRRHGGEVGGWWPRLCLHAEQLIFTHPKTGEAITVTAPIPQDMAAAWAAAGGPVLA